MRRCSGTAPPAAPTRSCPTGVHREYLERLLLLGRVGNAVAHTPAVRCRLYDAVMQAHVNLYVAQVSWNPSDATLM